MRADPEPRQGGRPRVVVVRGHQANPWELRPWELLDDSYDVTYLRSGRNWFDTAPVALTARRVVTLRRLLPPGRVGDLLVRVPGDRYLGLRRALRGADIVHAQELGYWYSMQAARLKPRLGFRLVLTVWETLPQLDTYRNPRTRRYRALTLAQTDLFLAATERARTALELEGVDPQRIRVLPPGIDVARFSTPARAPASPPRIVSIGRLVWEKGHQDAIRALAALRRGLVAAPASTRSARLLIVGAGPEKRRLESHARELGVQDAVEVRAAVPYDAVPGLLAGAAALVLASLPTRHWEEQFGMVLAEAMARGVPIVASASGAIPEVAGPQARYFAPGDWIEMARQLAAGPLAGSDPEPDPRRVERFSTRAAAARLRCVYDELLASAASERRRNASLSSAGTAPPSHASAT
jgi:glycosyltransferase involved in cell wall biosynthesis